MDVEDVMLKDMIEKMLQKHIDRVDNSRFVMIINVKKNGDCTIGQEGDITPLELHGLSDMVYDYTHGDGEYEDEDRT